MLRIILTTCLGLLLASTLQADITAENAYDFLITGELSVSVYVSPDDIDWIEDERAAAQRIDQLKTVLVRDPRNVHAAFELINLYEQFSREENAEEIANRTLSAFMERFNRDKDETSATRFAKVSLVAGAREHYDRAYRALLPFLESGRASRETCITAIENRVAQQDYGLAKRVADVYIQVYPRFAELHYQRYLISFTKNLRYTISETLQSSSEEFLNERNELYIDISNVEGFVHRYLEDLEAKIDSASLLKAIELDPSNYKYNLSAAVYRAMTYFFSKALIQLLAKDVEEEGIEKILQQADPDLLTLLHRYLKRAEDNRPKRDIQVFLGYAFINMVFGKFDEIEPYALLAIETRRDLPKAYDALLLSALLPSISADNVLNVEVSNRAIEIYKDKIKYAGENASDYSNIAGLYFSNYGEVDSASKGLMLERMKHYLDKTLDIDPQFIPGLIILSNYHIVMNNYRNAIKILDNIPKPEDPFMRGAIFNNLGIARILNGDREAGIADLREALQSGNEKTQNALQELGID